MVSFLLTLLIGAVIGYIVHHRQPYWIESFKNWNKTRKADYFLNHQIDYFKPIEKGTYPKEEEIN